MKPMHSLHRTNYYLLITFFALVGAVAMPAADSATQLISPHFTPPPEFAGQLGNYRSPLLFNDGSRVKSA
ncbi:MAG: hypothetical protein EB034_01965, partial [Verrucomicrobia bacterium]|nr:hypothetical protein [Verrucomicrobiota bacterium]